MAIAKMDTTMVRSFRHLKDDLFVEVITFYLNTYDGLGNKLSSRQDKESLRQVYYGLHPETKGMSSSNGTEIYEFPDGKKVLMVGTGRDINGNSI